MEPSPEMIDELDRDDIAQSRRMTPAEKLRAGGDLFDEVCRWMLAGIRADFPGISESGAREELRRRLKLADADQGD